MKYSLGTAVMDRAYRVELTIGDLKFYTAQRFFNEAQAKQAVAEAQVEIDRVEGDE